MLNYIWSGMLIVSFIIGMINGRMQEITKAVVESAGKAIELSIALLGIMCLWTGLMTVAERSGAIDFISMLFRPLLRILFPGIPKRHSAIGAIVMNLSANFLGLGNAATPLGLKAMQEMQKLNPDKNRATDAMCMFLVLNTSAVQLIPATVIAIRMDAGSVNPSEIIVTVWVASICASIAGIIAARFFSSTGFRKYRNESSKKHPGTDI